MSEEPRMDLEHFRAAIARNLGLSFHDDKLPLLSEVLASRMRDTRASDVNAYLARLSPHGAEVQELARQLSVGETSFLRNRDQFRALEALLRESAWSGPVRMLSAGCASGEEPYSLAITAREVLRDPSAVSITGFDFNPSVLEKARTARYSAWSLRETPDELRERYFRQEAREYVLREEIRGMVRFEVRNLVDPSPAFWRPEAFDVVFCRNVLMYLTPEAAREVVARIARSLAPGGYLFLGHAETLRGLSRDFHLHHAHRTFYYQRLCELDSAPLPVSIVKAPEPAAAARPQDRDWFDTIAQSLRRLSTLSSQHTARRAAASEPCPVIRPLAVEEPASAPSNLQPAMEFLQQEKFADALAHLSELGDAHGEDPDALLLEAALLISSGDAPAAEAACLRLLELDELSAGAHYVMALCRDHAGDVIQAAEHDRVAAYLDPDFAMPRLHLGLLARREEDTARARRELKLALGLLAREDAARILLFGGGFQRQALVELCSAELRSLGERP